MSDDTLEWIKVRCATGEPLMETQARWLVQQLMYAQAALAEMREDRDRLQVVEAQAAVMRQILEEEKLCHACGGTGKQHRHDSLYDRSEWTCGACAGSGLRSHIAEALAGDAGRALLAERDGLLTTIASREEEIERLRQAMQAAADESHAAITYEQGLRDRQRERAETAEQAKDQCQAVAKAALECTAAYQACEAYARQGSVEPQVAADMEAECMVKMHELIRTVDALAALEKETPEQYMQRHGWKYAGSASDDA